MNYTQISFEDINPEQVEMLIAILPDFGFHGMEETYGGIKAYATEGLVDFESLKELSSSMNISFSVNLIEEENWNKTWESNFDPVVIPGKIQVRAHFHEPLETVQHQILITPKMSFGTGHHPTTKMMMLAMLELDFKGKNVIDFGTGTGILSILAIQLGAQKVYAIDNDEWSIDNVKENVQLNNASNIDVLKASDLEQIKKSDVIVANINKNVLIDHVQSIYSKANRPGNLVISGLLRTDYEDIMKVYEPVFGSSFKSFEEGDWLAISFQL
jgi:ribosomal protein L11 methyltransferase